MLLRLPQCLSKESGQTKNEFHTQWSQRIIAIIGLRTSTRATTKQLPGLTVLHNCKGLGNWVPIELVVSCGLVIPAQSYSKSDWLLAKATNLAHHTYTHPACIHKCTTYRYDRHLLIHLFAYLSMYITYMYIHTVCIYSFSASTVCGCVCTVCARTCARMQATYNCTLYHIVQLHCSMRRMWKEMNRE